MSRTFKDKKANKKWDKRYREYNSGVKKEFKRASNKKMRRTPLTSYCLDNQYREETVKIRIPRNIVKGSLPTDKYVEVTITIATPSYVEVENTPQGLDRWEIE